MSEMYGSIHTHIESSEDAVNAHFNDKGKISFDQALNEFHKLGAKKIAVTEHGAFSSYENIYDASKNFDDLEVIPGCEIYLDYKGDKDRSHLILIAKDREGYLELCKIISDSNKNVVIGATKTYPITTMDILQKYVKKGHLIATSACIAGPLCKSLQSDVLFLEDKIEKNRKRLDKLGYFTAKEKIDAYNRALEEAAIGVPSKEYIKECSARKDKAAMDKAKKEIKVYKAKIASEEFVALKEEAIKADKFIKKEKLTLIANNYYKNLEELPKLKELLINGTGLQTAKETYHSLYNLFGDDFYFEIQNHHLETERKTYNELVKFAIDEGNPQFIASNDIHICMHKSNPDFNREVTRRKVATFIGLKNYGGDRIDDYEYGIKTDAELKDELLDIIEDYKGYSKEWIVDNAISNIKGALDKCSTYEHIYEDHYPKFCDNDKEIFEKEIIEGIKIKFPNGFPKGQEDVYKERLKKEVKIIEEMGYASYHLIVQDYLKYGRLLGFLPKEDIKNAPLSVEELDKYITEKEYNRRGYSIGPGRGSAAGSLACYLLNITDIDPIKYNLLFERFLNPERKSMPKQYWASTVNPITQGCA